MYHVASNLVPNLCFWAFIFVVAYYLTRYVVGTHRFCCLPRVVLLAVIPTWWYGVLVSVNKETVLSREVECGLRGR